LLGTILTFSNGRRRRESMNVRQSTAVARRRTRPRRESPRASEERWLVAQAKSGCSSAFGQLYARYRLKIYRTTFCILRHQQDAEDAAQRSFQRAFTNLNKFRGDSTFATWVTRIAINEALMLLRQTRGRTPLAQIRNANSEKPLVPDVADAAPSPEQTAVANEIRAAVTEAISNLRKNQQAVLRLRELQGLTNEETARHLGLTVAAVKSRIFHAKRHLRRNLEQKLKPRALLA
jgi:RNA polymerase sigma-70 factor, ECF subfamily